MKGSDRRARQAHVLARDGLDCWICGDEMWLEAPINHPLAFSLDHVMPKAFGGRDCLDNLRGAHRICNSARLSSRKDHERMRGSDSNGGEAERQV